MIRQNPNINPWTFLAIQTTCNLATVMKVSTLCLSILVAGCVEKTHEVEEKIPRVESTVPQAETKLPLVEAQTPVDPPFDGRGEFQEVVEFLKSSVPPRISWFQMNQGLKESLEDPTLDKEAFQTQGVLQTKSSFFDLHLLDYDWDSVRKEGVLYWGCMHYLQSVPLVYRYVYRVTIYESSGELKVGKIEEHYGAANGLDVKILAYDTQIVHFKPSSNLDKYWALVLENYNK